MVITMRISGSNLEQFSKGEGVNGGDLRVYQSRSGGYKIEVLKKKSGVKGKLQKMALAIKHVGHKKLDAAETSSILFRAAQFQENKELCSRLQNGGKISKAAIQLTKKVATYNQDKAKVDLLQVSKNYDLSHADQVGANASKRTEELVANRLGRELENLAASLTDQATEIKDVQASTKAQGLLIQTQNIINKTDEIFVGKALSDLWRSVDKVLIRKGSDEVLFNGPLKAEQRNQSLAEPNKDENDRLRGVAAKDALSLFAQQDPSLTTKQKEAFEQALADLQPVEWTTNNEAQRWGQALVESNKNRPDSERLPNSFFKKLRVLSQDLSTGLYAHSTQLNYSAAARREDGISISENTENKRFIYTTLPDGQLKLTIQQNYKIHFTPKVDDKVQIGDLQLNGDWEFDSEMTTSIVSYNASNLRTDRNALLQAASLSA